MEPSLDEEALAQMRARYDARKAGPESAADPTRPEGAARTPRRTSGHGGPAAATIAERNLAARLLATLAWSVAGMAIGAVFMLISDRGAGLFWCGLVVSGVACAFFQFTLIALAVRAGIRAARHP